MAKIKKKEYILDYETTSVRKYSKVKKKKIDVKTGKLITVYEDKLDPTLSKAFVCAWAFTESGNEDPDKVITNRTIEQNWEFIKDLTIQNISNGFSTTIFTYNLGFDSEFLLYYVLKKDLAVITSETRDQDLYSFVLSFVSEGKDFSVTFRDLSKIFPGSVDALGARYGIAKLKGSWDYNKYRDENTPITKKEWEYVKHDVLICAKALQDYRDRGYTQNTLAAIAYNDRLKRTYPRFVKYYARKVLEKDGWDEFRDCFPDEIKPLPYEVHVKLLSAYFGGLTYLNPKYASKLIKYTIFSYDENSMYPDKMRNAFLPVGDPILISKKEMQDPYIREMITMLYTRARIYHITSLTMTLKSPSHIPVAMFPTEPGKAVRSQGKVIACYDCSCWLTHYDLEMIEREYDIRHIEYGEAYCFKAHKGKYAAFVDYWMDKKEEATNEMNKLEKEGKEDFPEYLFWANERQIAKLMMNSSYGKDGTKLVRDKKETRFDREADELTSVSDTEETLIEYYLPDAIFITAIARWDWYNMAKAMGDHFIYGDTDSGKTDEEGDRLMRASGKPIDNTKLGAWKMEGKFEQGIFVRQKTYGVRKKNKWEWTVCGATQDVKHYMDINKFKPGMIITLDMIHSEINPETGFPYQGKLRPVRVRGGVILEESGFQISQYDNWDEEFGWYDWTGLDKKNLPIPEFKVWIETEMEHWLEETDDKFSYLGDLIYNRIKTENLVRVERTNDYGIRKNER